MRIEGTIRSFVQEKRFGFADGRDGKSYFVHLNSFVSPPPQDALVEGALVTFTPHPTPKGLAARQVRYEEKQGIRWVRPDRFLFLKDMEVRVCKAIALGSLIDVEGKSSPDEARAALADLAHSLGATAVLGARYVKGKAHRGNYTCTVHGYEETPAVVMQPKPTMDLAEIAESERECISLVEEFERRCESYWRKRRRDEVVRMVLKTALFIAAAVMVVRLFA
ncbi:cold shock domain-containing protein [Azospirillum sp. YIM B02556]|uniref:Cold shock domain-containing protein n=1 Tax=Azospirillum endophyticum TaxID=2800326 RepID=A0ABS1F8D3_9PROT|nr:cold shock domain-containing protein [Azospirillum endophyticum]MBK1839659.1 cold shock domain-containing protein [Azospirillum endophyticum]